MLCLLLQLYELSLDWVTNIIVCENRLVSVYMT